MFLGFAEGSLGFQKSFSSFLPLIAFVYCTDKNIYMLHRRKR